MSEFPAAREETYDQIEARKREIRRQVGPKKKRFVNPAIAMMAGQDMADVLQELVDGEVDE